AGELSPSTPRDESESDDCPSRGMNSPFDLHGRSAGARDWGAMALGASPSTIKKMIVSWGAGLAEPALPRVERRTVWTDTGKARADAAPGWQSGSLPFKFARMME